MPRTKKTVTKASSPAKAATKLVDAVAKKAEEAKSKGCICQKGNRR